MSYNRYFPVGQKTFLKRVVPSEQRTALDAITGYVTGTGANYVDFSLPYGSDAANDYPFLPGMRFELVCDNRGLGVRLQASFLERTGGSDIRLQFEGNLEFIARRHYRRIDVTAWIGLKRGADNLAEMRAAWENNLQQLQTGVPANQLTEFQKCAVNLAGGGLRVTTRASVKLAELFLIFLSIGDGGGIICALTEVIWVGRPGDDGQASVGLRFLNILDNDQERINQIVHSLLFRLEEASR